MRYRPSEYYTPFRNVTPTSFHLHEWQVWRYTETIIFQVAMLHYVVFLNDGENVWRKMYVLFVCSTRSYRFDPSCTDDIISQLMWPQCIFQVNARSLLQFDRLFGDINHFGDVRVYVLYDCLYMSDGALVHSCIHMGQPVYVLYFSL